MTELDMLRQDRDSYRSMYEKSVMERAKLINQLDTMTAERDELVGAAYEEVAKFAEVSAKGGCDPKKLPNIIRALTPADATTALDHIRAQAKAEGRREALDMAVPYMNEDRWRRYKSAILAAAQKEAGK